MNPAIDLSDIPSDDLAAELLKRELAANPQYETLGKTVLEVVCSSYNISLAALLSATQEGYVTSGRHAAIWLLSQMGCDRYSSAKILNKTISTIDYGNKKMDRMLIADESNNTFERLSLMLDVCRKNLLASKPFDPYGEPPPPGPFTPPTETNQTVSKPCTT